MLQKDYKNQVPHITMALKSKDSDKMVPADLSHLSSNIKWRREAVDFTNLRDPDCIYFADVAMCFLGYQCHLKYLFR